MDVFYQNPLVSVILRLIAADGEINEKEVEYLSKSFEFEYSVAEPKQVYENCEDAISHFFDEQFSYMCSINEKLADAYKELLAMICDIII